MEDYFFSPDAIVHPAVTPVKPRPSPMTEYPLQCSINLRTNIIRCVNNESRGELQFMGGVPVAPFYGGGGGRGVVNEPADSPLNRILTRPPTGPWVLVGAAVTTEPSHSSAREKTMSVYSQTVDSARNKYNYRVVDGNNVPLDIGTNESFRDDGSLLHIPGYHGAYRLKLYNQYRY